jgi:DNA-binding NarL/FixJ family response regulator
MPIVILSADATLINQREILLLKLLAKGNSNKEIAEQLNCSERSVQQYLKRITEKLSARSRINLPIVALKNNLIKLEEL